MTAEASTSRRNLLKGGAATMMVGTTAAANGRSAEAQTLANGRGGRFQGKVIAITGGNSGIGASAVRAFAMEGGKVVFGARRDSLGRDIEAELRSAGADVTWLQTDVRDPEQVARFIQTATEEYGALDVLFNNAGIFMTPNNVDEISLENFDDLMRTNVHGVFYGMKYAVPVMRAQGSGVILNMASVAAHRGLPNTAHYNASKHAVLGLTRAGAQLARENIRVTAISPFAVATPMLEEGFRHMGMDPALLAHHFVTPRIMQPEEIAQIALFLASDAAAAFNGTDFDASGGEMA